MRVFKSPRKYLQGPNSLQHAGTYFAEFGEKGLLLSDAFVWQLLGKDLVEQVKENQVSLTFCQVSGETLKEEVLAFSKEKADFQFVVALGGGKVMDTAKGVAYLLKLPVIIIPTTAATDAPTSSISVYYDSKNHFKEYAFYPNNPDLILVDTTVIAKAPAKTLVAGMGDALATFVEGRSIYYSQGNTLAGGTGTIAAYALAKACEETIFAKGLLALESNKKQHVTPELEDIIEANTLLSGLGFENAGLSISHGLHNSLQSLMPEVHSLMHGEIVAYGTLIQLILENTPPKEFAKYFTFYQKLGLPTSLKDLHLENKIPEDFIEVAKDVLNQKQTVGQLKKQYSPKDIVMAFAVLENYSEEIERG